MCLPVFIQFLQDTCLAHLNHKTLLEFVTYLRPNGAAILFFSFSWARLGIVLLTPILCCGVFCLCFRKKVDCGA